MSANKTCWQSHVVSLWRAIDSHKYDTRIDIVVGLHHVIIYTNYCLFGVQQGNFELALWIIAIDIYYAKLYIRIVIKICILFWSHQ